jgi:hypothetical protein
MISAAKKCVPWLACGLLVVGTAVAGPFGAYYTKIDSGEPFEQVSRTGPWADIVVDLPDLGGTFVFWRASSYLPYWEVDGERWYVDEIVERDGDGDEVMPDRVNTYSRVAIIENTDERVVVHWRYLSTFGAGNPKRDIDVANFVDEYFSISPDGSVIRTVKQGTNKISDWHDPLNISTQRFSLTAAGLVEEEKAGPVSSGSPERVQGSTIRTASVGAPVKHWRFDEGIGDVTRESVDGSASTIAGHKSYWKKGVSGTALQFDGYNTIVALDPADSPDIADGLTLEAWIAIGAYPWNWCPIVQQGDDAGYALGIDAHAHVGFKLQVGGGFEELVSEAQLDRNRWYHVAGAFDKASGTMALYIDGTLSGSKIVKGGEIQTTDDAVQIGQGMERRPTEPVRPNTFVDVYSFDGLIDEVKIHNAPLSAAQVTASFEALEPSEAHRGNPDMEVRTLPAGPSSGAFRSFHTNLQFYETWDDLQRFGEHPDVVVELDASPAKFIFWRGTGYIPMMVTENGKWYSNEFNETWDTSGGQGCQEPMSDKEGFTNHVRIIENSPARVVVHWRYPLLDVLRVTANFDEETGWGDWSDWYYYIYPDGVAAKQMRLWTHGTRNHEWQESMAIFGPNQHPEQIIETRHTLTMANLDGEAVDYDWVDGPPRDVLEPEGKSIQLVNYIAEYDPFTIAEIVGAGVFSGELTPYAVFPTWNHWPVAQMPSDGRNASFPDRTAHSSLTHFSPVRYREDFGDAPWEERVLLEGMTRNSAADLVPLARSWIRAPELEAEAGVKDLGYEKAERAYQLLATEPTMSFSVNASEKSPIANLSFVIRNWGSYDEAELKINGVTENPGPGFRQGIVRNGSGDPTLVLWIEAESTEPMSFEISGAEPAPSNPPTPDPLTWKTEPKALDNAFAITMEATTASDPDGVEYLFECTTTGSFGSGWQKGPNFVARGLAPNTEYAFRVKARDGRFGETDWSGTVSATTGDAPPMAANWKMDAGSGTTLTDKSGRYSGRIERAEWVDGHRGKGLQFDGDGVVTITNADSLPATTNYSWTAWIKTTEGGTIVARGGEGKDFAPAGRALFVADDALVFYAAWAELAKAELDISVDRWRHVAVTVGPKDGQDSITLYVDGEAVASAPNEAGAAEEGDGKPIKIGYCIDGFPPGGSGFVGVIDDVRWFKYAIEADMVQQIYEGGL